MASTTRGMAVAGGDYGDAGGEIEEAVAVHVLDDGAFAFVRHQRIAARVGRRYDFRIAFDDGARAGTGQGSVEDRKVRTDLFQGLAHGNNSCSVFSCGVEVLRAGEARAAERGEELVGAEKAGAGLRWADPHTLILPLFGGQLR